MVEKHELEQYFWTRDTITHLADFASSYERVCCLCAPTLGAELGRRGCKVTNLDRDNRFEGTPGYRPYDLYRPERLEQSEGFDLIICDPPFYCVTLAQMFTALRLLADFRLDTPLMIGYLKRRERAVLGTFTTWGLRPPPPPPPPRDMSPGM